MKTRLSILTFAAVAGLSLGMLGSPASAADVTLPAAGPSVSASTAPAMSYGVGEVLKMYQSGISKDVILNYIKATALPYHLTANDVIYLHTIGIPEEITTTMIVRAGELQKEAGQQGMVAPQQVAAQPSPYPAYPYPPAQAQPNQTTVVVPATPAPAVSDYGYDYGYPSYDYGYPYYGGYPLVIGGGWGWGGWGGRGFYGGGFRGGFHGGFGGFHGGFGGGGFHGGGGGHGGGGHR